MIEYIKKLIKLMCQKLLIAYPNIYFPSSFNETPTFNLI